MSSISLYFFPRCVFYNWQCLKTNTKSCSLCSGEQAWAQRISQGVKHLVEKQAFPFTVHTLKNLWVVKTMEERREDLSPLITEITRQICWAIDASVLLRFCKHSCVLLNWKLPCMQVGLNLTFPDTSLLLKTLNYFLFCTLYPHR